MIRNSDLQEVLSRDSLSSDMFGAKNASLKSVWFMPSGNVEKAMTAYEINYLLFRTLYAAKTGRNRQIKCTSHLMENDEKHVRIHEVFS